MNIDELALTFLTTICASGLGAWLSIRYLPLKARKDEWEWKKSIEAKQFFLDSLTELTFLSGSFVECYINETFNLPDKNEVELRKEILSIVRRVHQQGEGQCLHLTSQQRKVVTGFLQESLSTLNDCEKQMPCPIDDGQGKKDAYFLTLFNSVNNCSTKYLNEFKKCVGFSPR